MRREGMQEFVGWKYRPDLLQFPPETNLKANLSRDIPLADQSIQFRLKIKQVQAMQCVVVTRIHYLSELRVEGRRRVQVQTRPEVSSNNFQICQNF